jgi:hypothetical protein
MFIIDFIYYIINLIKKHFQYLRFYVFSLLYYVEPSHNTLFLIPFFSKQEYIY